MKLISFTAPDASVGVRVGALRGDADVVDLSGTFSSMLALLDGGDDAIEEARRLADQAATVYPRDSIRLLSPVPRPRSIRDCMSYEQHVVQATRTVVGWRFPPLAALDSFTERLLRRGFLRAPRVWYRQPIYYKGNPASVVGPDAEVRRPAFTEKLDFELEIGCFIGRAGRDIREEEALQHIAGYAIFNDFSARDVQLREMQGRLGPAKGKDFDTGNAIGPWLVTPDEVGDPLDLRVAARVNGVEWCRGTTAGPQFTFAQILAHISRDETLYPGDFVGAGTVPNGCGLERDRWLRPGDTVELEVECLGTLRNKVVRE